VQCQTCGKVYEIPETVSVDVLYIMAYCPRCEGEIALNLGSEDEIYEYYNNSIDPRFYEY
jgi:phage FluMu protein Com